MDTEIDKCIFKCKDGEDIILLRHDDATNELAISRLRPDKDVYRGYNIAAIRVTKENDEYSIVYQMVIDNADDRYSADKATALSFLDQFYNKIIDWYKNNNSDIS